MLENIDLTQIIVAVIGVLATIITTKLIPYLKAKTGAENWDILLFWSATFVKGAEVIFDKSGAGKDKLNYVTFQIKKKCDELGLKFDGDDIRNAIENAWSEMEKEAVFI